MPIVLPKQIPAFKTLESENVNIMAERRAQSQDIRPLEIIILNLMPKKIETETQLLRVLSNSPLQVHFKLLRTESYLGVNTPLLHLEQFYTTFEQIRHQNFDGMIVTGAPIEHLDFHEIDYWDELKAIFDYAAEHVTTNLYICWGALAALHHHFGIHKERLDAKLFGVYEQTCLKPTDNLLRGLNPEFGIPFSCHALPSREEVRRCRSLTTLVASEETGPAILKTDDDRHIFFTGHLEYETNTLQREYERDLARGLTIDPPVNYYGRNGKPKLSWHSSASLVFTNWLNYYVYQRTPYDLAELGHQLSRHTGPAEKSYR